MNRKDCDYKFPCPRCGNQGHDRNSKNCPALQGCCEYCRKPGHVKGCCYELKYKNPQGELLRGNSDIAQSTQHSHRTKGKPIKKRRYEISTESVRKIPSPIIETYQSTTGEDKQQHCTIGGKQITFIVNPTLSFNVLPLAAYEDLTDMEFIVKTYDRVDIMVSNTMFLGIVTASVQTSGCPPVTGSFFIQDSIRKSVMLTRSLADKLKISS